MYEKLYGRYKSTPTEVIQSHLKNITIVRKRNDKYYPITTESAEKIINNPRGVSITFDATDLQDESIELTKIEKFDYLVKSTSRFFLKPDIGEIFDQCNEIDLRQATAIYVNIEDYDPVVGTDGEHFIMQATLMSNIKSIRKKKIEQINEKI